MGASSTDWLVAVAPHPPARAAHDFATWCAALPAPLAPEDILIDTMCGDGGRVERRYRIRATAAPSRGLFAIPAASLPAWLAHLARARRIFTLPDLIRDTTTFFRAVRATMPLVPPVISDDHWDALSDSLWEGLYDCDARQLVIAWPHPTPMQTASPADFAIAREVLTDLVESLADPALTVDAPRDLLVLLGA